MRSRINLDKPDEGEDDNGCSPDGGCDCAFCRTRKGSQDSSLLPKNPVYISVLYRDTSPETFLLPGKLASALPAVIEEKLSKLHKNGPSLLHLVDEDSKDSLFSVSGYYGTINLDEVVSIRILVKEEFPKNQVEDDDDTNDENG